MLAVARNRGLITGLWSTVLTLKGTHYELKVYDFFSLVISKPSRIGFWGPGSGVRGSGVQGFDVI